MGEIVYLLCSATALICSILLFRGYRQSRAKLLLWSGLCFFVLTLENIFLFLDLIVFIRLDLSPVRDALALAAVMFLLYGLIWENK